MEKNWDDLIFRALTFAWGDLSSFESLVSLVAGGYLEWGGTQDSIREVTMRLLAELLEKKWVEIWDCEDEHEWQKLDLPAKELLQLIDARWKRMDYGWPGMFGVCWYGLTEAGNAAFHRLSLARRGEGFKGNGPG